jgi:hypothetical protein
MGKNEEEIDMNIQPKPLTVQEFDEKFADRNNTFIQTVEFVNDYSSFKSIHTLIIKNSSGDIIYKEWYMEEEIKRISDNNNINSDEG